jgi:hypothetical protein
MTEQTADIMEQLHSEIRDREANTEFYDPDVTDMLKEVVNEIMRLRQLTLNEGTHSRSYLEIEAENERLREHLQDQYQMGHHDGYHDALEYAAEFFEHNNRVVWDWVAIAAALRALKSGTRITQEKGESQIEQLRKALEPFSYPDFVDANGWDDDAQVNLVNGITVLASITIADLRRIRALKLNPIPGFNSETE